MSSIIQPIFFRDIEVELVRVWELILTQRGEVNFLVATQKQKSVSKTQYLFRSEAGEILNRVFKSEDCALTIYVKPQTTMNLSYAESKRLGGLVEALLPTLSNKSLFISHVENVDILVNDFDDSSQIYTILVNFTVYHKGVNLEA